MIIKLLTEHNLECLSLKGDCRGSFESTHVKMSNCWQSHAQALISYKSGCNLHHCCPPNAATSIGVFFYDFNGFIAPVDLLMSPISGR